MRILIVDDEPLARKRLCTLLVECDARHQIIEAAHAGEALALLAQPPAFDAALLDIHMPGLDGMALAHQLQRLAQPPAIIFVTAHAEHALSAFELDAADYLTKPVRRERLQQALAKAQRRHAPAAPRPAAPVPVPDGPTLLVQDQGRTERIPLAEVLYVRAELKYLTLRTTTRNYVLDGALTELHERHPQALVRIHRNTLVARHALRALERHPELEEGDGWAVRLHGTTEILPVSRRQVAAVRELLLQGS